RRSEDHRLPAGRLGLLRLRCGRLGLGRPDAVRALTGEALELGLDPVTELQRPPDGHEDGLEYENRQILRLLQQPLAVLHRVADLLGYVSEDGHRGSWGRRSVSHIQCRKTMVKRRVTLPIA